MKIDTFMFLQLINNQKKIVVTIHTKVDQRKFKEVTDVQKLKLQLKKPVSS